MKIDTKDLLTALRQVDPVAGTAPLADADRRAHDFATIIDTEPRPMQRRPEQRRPEHRTREQRTPEQRTPGQRTPGQRTPGRRAPVRRRLVLAGMAVVAVGAAGAGVAGSVLLTPAAPAFAVTPDPLAYVRQSDAAQPAVLLGEIAARTERLPAERATGYQHLKRSEWNMWTEVSGHTASSVVVPTRSESWTAADGSGQTTTGYQRPTLRNRAETAAWERLGRPGADGRSTTERYGPGERSPMWSEPAPTDPTELAAFLAIGHPTANGPGETVVAITDLVREQVLSPRQRAALLRVLATVPGLTSTGETTDRAGRKGLAFSLQSDLGGLARQDTLVVDPATGRLLDWEELLLDAGKLRVRVPAIIGYEVYLVAEYSDQPR